MALFTEKDNRREGLGLMRDSGNRKKDNLRVDLDTNFRCHWGEIVKKTTGEMGLESREEVWLKLLICKSSAHWWELSLECGLDFPRQESRGGKREPRNQLWENSTFSRWTHQNQPAKVTFLSLAAFLKPYDLKGQTVGA